MIATPGAGKKPLACICEARLYRVAAGPLRCSEKGFRPCKSPTFFRQQQQKRNEQLTQCFNTRETVCAHMCNANVHSGPTVCVYMCNVNVHSGLTLCAYIFNVNTHSGPMWTFGKMEGWHFQPHLLFFVWDNALLSYLLINGLLSLIFFDKISHGCGRFFFFKSTRLVAQWALGSVCLSAQYWNHRCTLACFTLHGAIPGFHGEYFTNSAISRGSWLTLTPPRKQAGGYFKLAHRNQCHFRVSSGQLLARVTVHSSPLSSPSSYYPDNMDPNGSRSVRECSIERLQATLMIGWGERRSL